MEKYQEARNNANIHINSFMTKDLCKMEKEKWFQ